MVAMALAGLLFAQTPVGQARLELAYGARAALEIEAVGDRTRVRVTWPMEQAP